MKNSSKLILCLILLLISTLTFNHVTYASTTSARSTTKSKLLTIDGFYELSATSIFGDYHVEDETGKFTLSNPSPPDYNYSVEFDVYYRPLNNLTFYINPLLIGAWASEPPGLLFEEFYSKYYFSNSFNLTAGQYEQNLGPVALFLSKGKGINPGFKFEKNFSKTLMTIIYNRSFDASQQTNNSTDVDDFLACRFEQYFTQKSNKKNIKTLGANLLLDGLYHERAISFDYKGPRLTFEVGGYSPHKKLLEDLTIPNPTDDKKTITLKSFYEDKIYIGGLFAFELLNTPKQNLSLRTGYFEKGFKPYYGSLSYDTIKPFEDLVKYSGNTTGIELYYTQKLNKSWFLDVDLYYAKFLNENFANTTFVFGQPLQVYQIGVKKQFSPKSELKMDVFWYSVEKYLDGNLDNKSSYGKLSTILKIKF